MFKSNLSYFFSRSHLVSNATLFLEDPTQNSKYKISIILHALSSLALCNFLLLAST